MGLRLNGPSRRLLLPVIFIIILLEVAWLGLKFRQVQKHNLQLKQASVCGNDDIGNNIKKDTTILSPARSVELKPFADKAEILSGHEKSVNCMYILAAFYAYSGGYTKAKTYYASLQALKGRGNQIDSSYTVQAAKLDIYMKNIGALENLYKNADNRADPSMINSYQSSSNGQ